MSCSFYLRASRLTPGHPFRSPPPNTANCSLFSRPTIPERGSISAGRVPLRVSFNPSPPRNESRERRGKKAPTVGRHEERGELARKRERAIRTSRERVRGEKLKEKRREKDGGGEDRAADSGMRGGRERRERVSRARRPTHHILLSRLPTLTAGSVPDRRGRMPTTRAGREESRVRHPAC